jgi:hypothetical protein
LQQQRLHLGSGGFALAQQHGQAAVGVGVFGVEHPGQIKAHGRRVGLVLNHILKALGAEKLAGLGP